METIGIRGPWRWLKRGARFRRVLLGGRFQYGECPVCDSGTFFVRLSANLREDLLCFRCLSKPRWRALVVALTTYFPVWRDRCLYEASPAGSASLKFRNECRHYIGGHFFPDLPRGQTRAGFRCEDLEALTFADASLDLVISQDVMEHVLRPEKALAEIARVLRPGGAHVFTVPYFPDQPTVARVCLNGDRLEYLLDKQYHGDPIDDSGSLVVTDWGKDTAELVRRASGLPTEVLRFDDARCALAGEYVIISRKGIG